MEYAWKIWDRISPINGCSANDTGLLKSLDEVYLITNTKGETSILQTESERPYKDIPIRECAQRHCDEINLAHTNHLLRLADLKAQYSNGTITDAEIAEQIETGRLTQTQADEIMMEGKDGENN